MTPTDIIAIYERSLPDVQTFLRTAAETTTSKYPPAPPNEHPLRGKHRFTPSCPGSILMAYSGATTQATVRPVHGAAIVRERKDEVSHAADIRPARCRLHPRHWQALAQLTAVGPHPT